MIEEIIKRLVAQELAAPQFGMTEQFLAIHQIVYHNNEPVITRITEAKRGGLVAYLPVVQERFYLCVYLTTDTAAITWVETKPFHSVWLHATTEDAKASELMMLTSLAPTKSWNKGDARQWGSTTHKSSTLEFGPWPEPDTFERKLGHLLNFLEQDAAGIQALAVRAECIIRVASIFHNGNTMLGGHYLAAPTLRRIAGLGVSIDFDLYAEGKFFEY